MRLKKCNQFLKSVMMKVSLKGMYMAMGMLLIAMGMQGTELDGRTAGEEPVGETITKRFTVSGGFTRVEASGIYNVEVIKGRQDIAVTTDESIMKRVKVEVTQGGTLRLSLKSDVNEKNNRKSVDLRVRISMPALEGINAGGAANFTVGDGFDGKELTIEGDGASKIVFNTVRYSEFELKTCGASSFTSLLVDCRKCELDLSGAAKMSIKKVKCDKLEIDMSGASGCDIDAVDARTVDTECSGASHLKMDVVVAGLIECETSGGSNVTLGGKCGRARYDASGASRINARNINCAIVKAEQSGAAKILQ